jgi:hypothetical protein
MDTYHRTNRIYQFWSLKHSSSFTHFKRLFQKISVIFLYVCSNLHNFSFYAFLTMKNKKYHTVGTVLKYHTVGTVLKSNWKIVETEEKSISVCIFLLSSIYDFWLPLWYFQTFQTFLNTHIPDCYLSMVGTYSSIKRQNISILKS